MAKKSVSIRIPQELLEKKPDDLTLTDWITECIHIWILEKEGLRKKLEKEIEKSVKKIEEIQLQLNTKEIDKAVSTLQKTIFQLEDALQEVNELEKISKQLKQLKEKINNSLICKIEKYSWRDW